MFEIGNNYTKVQIGSALNCEMQGYLPNKDGRVVCATVTKSYNPDAPDVILPGFGPQIQHWGDVFCGQKWPIPVFVKANGSEWTYVGNYQVARCSQEPLEIARQQHRSGRTDISKVLFLQQTMPQGIPQTALPAHPLNVQHSPEAISAMLQAAKQGNVEAVRRRLDRGIPPDAVDEDGESALMVAAWYGHLSVVDLLLSRGADVNLRDMDDKTAADLASAKGYDDVTARLRAEYRSHAPVPSPPLLVTAPPLSSLTPSSYQQRIYDFQRSGQGDGFVEAVAGSGKTTTLVGCAERLPQQEREQAIFVAFNRHIAEELATRLPTGVVTQTIHSIGLQAFLKSLRNSRACEVIDRKYLWLSEHFLAQETALRKDRRLRELTNALHKLVHFVMVTLTNPSDGAAVEALTERLDQPFEPWQVELMEKAVPTVIRWGQSGMPERDRRGHTYAMQECISYDDMIYLPHALGLSVPTYRMVYCDEAQDLSAAQLGIVLKLRAPGGRILFVGDPRQSIYAFAGADSGSVDTIIYRTGATRLPLSVCYRCPRLHVEMAKEIVPQIEARDDAPDGVFAVVTQDEMVTKVRPDDLILCRLTAPLVYTAFQIISAGKPAKVRGRDIGEDLIAVVSSVERIKGYTWAGFLGHLYQYQMRMVGLLQHEEADPLALISVKDRVKTVEIIHQRVIVEGKGENASDLKKAITDLFREAEGATVLSTVHRAKGLESARVFILHEDEMPHPKAKKREQIAQEWNLRYVALTRAKEELYFVVNRPPSSGTGGRTINGSDVEETDPFKETSSYLRTAQWDKDQHQETSPRPAMSPAPIEPEPTERSVDTKGHRRLVVQSRSVGSGKGVELLIFDGTQLIGEYERCGKLETVARKTAEVHAATTVLRTAFREHGFFVVRWNGTAKQKEIHQGNERGPIIGTVPWK